MGNGELWLTLSQNATNVNSQGTGPATVRMEMAAVAVVAVKDPAEGGPEGGRQQEVGVAADTRNTGSDSLIPHTMIRRMHPKFT
jgi:hypothetical protein